MNSFFQYIILNQSFGQLRDLYDYETRESLILAWAPSFAAATPEDTRVEFLRRCYKMWIRRFPEDLLGGRSTYAQETRQVESVELPSLEDLPDFISGWLEAANEVC